MRIVLVQPDDARAAEMIAEFDESGDSVVRATGGDESASQALGSETADALLVCLDARPDVAIELADELSARRRLRGVPLLFAGGSERALSEAQRRFPKASFTRLDVLHTALASLRS